MNVVLARASACAIALFAAAAVQADIYVLDNEGRVQGELVNVNESPRKTFVIRTAEGPQVTLDKRQVKQIIPQSAVQLEYERLRPTFEDTVDGQWRLAEWCKERNLSKERTAHLERVVELDSNHKPARSALGFSLVDARWVRPDQLWQERGYVRYKGAWRVPQEVELLEQKRKVELAQKDWFNTLRRWRGVLDAGGNKAYQAAESIREIDDPHAVPALTHYLVKDDVDEYKYAYIKVLARIGTADAIGALVNCSLDDADDEARALCLDQLAPGEHPQAVKFYVNALSSKDNVRINRAAVGLAHLKDPSAISPLIDALVTTHKRKVVRGNPGATSTSFSKDGGGGGGIGVGSSVQIIKEQIPNRDVLDALVKLVEEGVNFHYDVKAWKQWYAAQFKSPVVDARRD